VVANDRALRLRRRSTTAAVIANVRTVAVSVAVHAAVRAPRTFDPDVTAAARFPTSLFPDVANALALVITVAPDPLATTTRPAAFDPDVARASVDHDNARRGRFLLDLDVRHRYSDVTLGTHDASGA